MLQRTRLHLPVKEWYDAPREEALIEKSKLVAREIILSKNNDAIAKWLYRRYEYRAKVMKTLKRKLVNCRCLAS